MIYFKNSFIYLFILFLIFLPVFSFAQDGGIVGTVPCNGPDCGFAHLMILFRNIIDFIVTYLIIPMATISFAFVGAKLLLNPNNPGTRSEAKKSLGKIVMGLIVIVGAWLIVRFVLGVFLNEEVINTLPVKF